MNKKYVLSFGIISMTIAPAAVVVSCSFPEDQTNAITTEINNVQEKMVDTLKTNSSIENDRYFFDSTKDDETLVEDLKSAQGDKLSIANVKTIDSLMGINSTLGSIDLKGTTTSWTYIRTESPVGATYTIAVTISKSTVKPQYVELWVRSKDFNLVNEEVKAVEEVKYKLTDKIKGTYRSTLNPTKMDEKIGKSAMTVNEFASIIDTNLNTTDNTIAFYSPTSTDLTASNKKTSTLKFEIRSVGAILIDDDGSAERKSYTIYGVLVCGDKKDEFAFTLNSSKYTSQEKLDAEEARFKSQLGNIGTEAAPIYTLGSLNTSNRNILPSTFVAEDSYATNIAKEIIGFDDSRRIFGTSYSFKLPTGKTHSDDYGTVDIIVTLSVEGKTPIETTVTFKNFQTKLGADTAIAHAINGMASNMYDVQRHNNKLIKGKAVSITDTKLEKLPSEILKDKEWGPSSIKNLIPVAFTGFTDDLLDISFDKNEINTDDLRGELGIEVKISYKDSVNIFDTFILLLTGFRTIQDVAVDNIDTSEIKVGSVDMSIIVPVDGQIVESPSGSGTIVEAHKALYKVLKNSLKTKDGNFITTIDFGDYSQYYTGFQILATGGWGTSDTKKIKIKIILRRDGYEFSATTEEINLVP